MSKTGAKKDTVSGAIRVNSTIILLVADRYLSSILSHTQTLTHGDNSIPPPSKSKSTIPIHHIKRSYRKREADFCRAILRRACQYGDR